MKSIKLMSLFNLKEDTIVYEYYNVHDILSYKEYKDEEDSLEYKFTLTNELLNKYFDYLNNSIKDNNLHKDFFTLSNSDSFILNINNGIYLFKDLKELFRVIDKESIKNESWGNEYFKLKLFMYNQLVNIIKLNNDYDYEKLYCTLKNNYISILKLYKISLENKNKNLIFNYTYSWNNNCELVIKEENSLKENFDFETIILNTVINHGGKILLDLENNNLVLIIGHYNEYCYCGNVEEIVNVLLNNKNDIIKDISGLINEILKFKFFVDNYK